MFRDGKDSRCDLCGKYKTQKEIVHVKSDKDDYAEDVICIACNNKKNQRYDFRCPQCEHGYNRREGRFSTARQEYVCAGCYDIR